jgi:hypothetical protein
MARNWTPSPVIAAEQFLLIQDINHLQDSEKK